MEELIEEYLKYRNKKLKKERDLKATQKQEDEPIKMSTQSYQRNHYDLIIDEFLDLKAISNEIYCKLPEKKEQILNSIKFSFSLEPEQLKTLETEELYNHLFTNLRQNHLQKMYETVEDKLQDFET